MPALDHAPVRKAKRLRHPATLAHIPRRRNHRAATGVVGQSLIGVARSFKYHRPRGIMGSIVPLPVADDVASPLLTQYEVSDAVPARRDPLRRVCPVQWDLTGCAPTASMPGPACGSIWRRWPIASRRSGRYCQGSPARETMECVAGAGGVCDDARSAHRLRPSLTDLTFIRRKRISSAAARWPAATRLEPTASSWSGCCPMIRRKSCRKARRWWPSPGAARRRRWSAMSRRAITARGSAAASPWRSCGGRRRHLDVPGGEQVWAMLPNRTVAARICPPVFYDREGRRRDGSARRALAAAPSFRRRRDVAALAGGGVVINRDELAGLGIDEPLACGDPFGPGGRSPSG